MYLNLGKRKTKSNKNRVHSKGLFILSRTITNLHFSYNKPCRHVRSLLKEELTFSNHFWTYIFQYWRKMIRLSLLFNGLITNMKPFNKI